MKAIVSMFAALSLAMGLFGGLSGREPQPGPEEFILVVDLQTEDEVRVLSYDYSLNGEFVGGGQCWEAGMNYPLTGPQYLSLTAGDFPALSDTEGFGLRLYLSGTFESAWEDTHSPDTAVSGEIYLPVAYGTLRRIVVTGSREAGYSAYLVPESEP